MLEEVRELTLESQMQQEGSYHSAVKKKKKKKKKKKCADNINDQVVQALNSLTEKV